MPRQWEHRSSLVHRLLPITHLQHAPGCLTGSAIPRPKTDGDARPFRQKNVQNPRLVRAAERSVPRTGCRTAVTRTVLATQLAAHHIVNNATAADKAASAVALPMPPASAACHGRPLIADFRRRHAADLRQPAALSCPAPLAVEYKLPPCTPGCLPLRGASSAACLLLGSAARCARLRCT